LSISEARFVLISRHTTCISLHDKLLEEKKKSSPKLEEEVFIATLQTFQPHDLAIHPKPATLQNPLREEEILPLEILSNDDFGRSINFLLHKRHFSTYSLNLLKKGSLRKLFKSNPFEGYLKILKDGMLSDVIEGERNHLESTPIFSPSMSSPDVKFDPIFKPILDPYDSPYALPPKTHGDPRNPPRYPMYRNHLDHKKDREEQHQWLKSIKNLCAIAIECVDEALYETSSRGNPREILDIYGESSLEARNDGDFNEQGSYFIKTPSNPCSYEISSDSPSLSLTLPHMKSSTPHAPCS
jgi:hypothetical protein